MRASEVPARRRFLVLGRWGLIAVCASLILFSDRLDGRPLFAVLLLLAVILGRYSGRWYARLPRAAEPRDLSLQPQRRPSAREALARRRQAGP